MCVCVCVWCVCLSHFNKSLWRRQLLCSAGSEKGQSAEFFDFFQV